jgi:acyl carrier protein
MKRLKQVLINVLDIEEDLIKDETTPGDVENWDSLGGLMLALELEKEFEIQFTQEEVVNVTCIGDIKYYLQKHSVNLVNED